MNTFRRSKTMIAIRQLKKQKRALEEILEQEEQALDDLPEVLLESTAAISCQEYIFALEGSLELLSHSIDCLTSKFIQPDA